jgi:hypothetical protein
VTAWAELVFHVLAHVRGGVAASAFDPTWIAFAERHLGAASARHLGEDAALLAGAATSHDALAELQLLAWLFEDSARAAACAERTLAELTPADVDDPAVLAHLAGNGLAEVLRAAAELEAEAFAALPEVARGRVDYATVLRAAPWLARFSIDHLRPLRIRGRVRGERVFVGVASEALAVTPEHVAWQAAHEATVAEVHRRARARGLPVTHHPLEHTALVLLAEGARSIGESAAHATWIGHFANVPRLDREELPPAWRALLQSTDARA